MLATIPQQQQQQQQQPHRHHCHRIHGSGPEVTIAAYCSAAGGFDANDLDAGDGVVHAGGMHYAGTPTAEVPRLNWADIYSDDDEGPDEDDEDENGHDCRRVPTHRPALPAAPPQHGRGGRCTPGGTNRRSRGGRNNNIHCNGGSNNRSPRNTKGAWRNTYSDSCSLDGATSRSWRIGFAENEKTRHPTTTCSPPAYPSSPTESVSPVSSIPTPEQTPSDAAAPEPSFSSQLFEGSDFSSPIQRGSTGLEDDDEDDCVAEGEDVDSSKLDTAVNFVGLWSAWFDPPKAPGSRGGISFDTYMEQLYEMGTIFDSRDFWIIHEQIDWENVPSGSMISFSRKGSKPCWEDPLNCNGARLVIRGFPRNFSERLFTTVCLALLLGHFPNSQSLTCASLQVKDSRRGGNAVHIWSQEVDMEQFRALEEHVLCLCGNTVGSAVDSPRSSGAANRPRSSGKRGAAQPLRFEYCANSEAIERNVCRLDGGSRGGGLRRCGSSLQTSTASLAANCDVVAQLYSAGKGSKRGGKSAASKKGRGRGGRAGNCGKKLDWADVLLQEISSTTSLASTSAGTLSPSKSCTTLSSFNSVDSGTFDSVASVGAQWSAASRSTKRKSRRR